MADEIRAMPDPRPGRDTDDAAYSGWPARDDVAQIVGVVGGPIALLLGLQAKYAIAQEWACGSSAGTALVHLAAIVTLALTVGAGVLAWRQWRPAARGADPGDGGGREGRTRTMATLGVTSSALSALVVVAQWLPQFFLGRCQP